MHGRAMGRACAGEGGASLVLSYKIFLLMSVVL